jgi:sugar O-acyltransferase (sialic acid O-acetyltransferase NeuD family)
MGRLYLCGAGNPEGVRLAIRTNARERLWDELILLDDDPSRHGERQMGVTVAGAFGMLAQADPATSEVVNLIARTTRRRRDARARIAQYGIPWAPLISTDVDLLGAEVGRDLIAYQHATIGPGVRIGEGAVVFMGATIGHECQVQDHCIVASNAVLNARVRLGTGVYIGSNAVVLPEIAIGDEAVIGAGAVVIDDVPAGATVVGGIGEIVRPATATAPAARAVAPLDATALGALLHALWCEQLGVAQVQPTRSFFEDGGSSLDALRLAQRIESATGLPVSAVDLFQYPTLNALRAHLSPDPATNGPTTLDLAQRRAELRRGLGRRPSVI